MRVKFSWFVTGTLLGLALAAPFALPRVLASHGSVGAESEAAALPAAVPAVVEMAALPEPGPQRQPERALLLAAVRVSAAPFHRPALRLHPPAPVEPPAAPTPAPAPPPAPASVTPGPAPPAPPAAPERVLAVDSGTHHGQRGHGHGAPPAPVPQDQPATEDAAQQAPPAVEPAPAEEPPAGDDEEDTGGDNGEHAHGHGHGHGADH